MENVQVLATTTHEGFRAVLRSDRYIEIFSKPDSTCPCACIYIGKYAPLNKTKLLSELAKWVRKHHAGPGMIVAGDYTWPVGRPEERRLV
jgi:hypothetical protein